MSIYNLYRTLAVSEDREQTQTRVLSVAIKELIKEELLESGRSPATRSLRWSLTIQFMKLIDPVSN